MRSSTERITSSKPTLRVRVYWGDILYDTALFGPGETLTVGSSARARFVMELGEDLPTAEWNLISTKRDGSAALNFFDGVRGHIDAQGTATPLRLLIDQKKVNTHGKSHSVAIQPGEGASIVYRDVSFYVDWITPEPKLPQRRTRDLGELAFRLVGTALLAGLMWGVSFFKAPPLPTPVPTSRVVEILKSPEITPPAPVVEAVPPEVEPEPVAPEPVKKVEPPRPAQKKIVRKAEPASPPKTAPTAKLGSLLSGLKNLKAQAPRLDESRNVGGGGATGGVGNIEGPRAASLGSTKGQGSGHFRGGSRSLTGESTAQISGSPGLTRPQIDSVVRSRGRGVKRCYEQGLAANPGLAGTILVRFVVGASGSVISARPASSTLADAAVTQCIMSEVKSWKFPKPTGGASVTVEYPFDLTPGG
jgi:outer membrane biosynthesis protein TonB